MTTQFNTSARRRIFTLLRTMSAQETDTTSPAPAKKVKTGIDRKSVADVSFSGQRVLMRVDFNVPRDKTSGLYVSTVV